MEVQLENIIAESAPCMGLTIECREQEEKNKKQKTAERMIEIIQSVAKRKYTERKQKMNRVPETLFKVSTGLYCQNR